VCFSFYSIERFVLRGSDVLNKKERKRRDNEMFLLPRSIIPLVYILLISSPNPNRAINEDENYSSLVSEDFIPTSVQSATPSSTIPVAHKLAVLFDNTLDNNFSSSRSSRRRLQTLYFSYADYFLYQNDAYLANMGRSMSMSTGILAYGTAGAGEVTTAWNDLTSYGVEGEWIPEVDPITFTPYRNGVSVSAGNFSAAYGARSTVVIQKLPFQGSSPLPWTDAAKFGPSVILPSLTDTVGGVWPCRDALDTDSVNGGTSPGASLSLILQRRWGSASSFGSCMFPSGPFITRNNITFANQSFTISNLALCGQDKLFVRGVFAGEGGSFVSALSLVSTSGVGSLSAAAAECLQGPSASGCHPDGSSYVPLFGTYTRAWVRTQLWYSQSSNFGLGLACNGPNRVAISSPDTNVVTVFAESSSLIDIGPWGGGRTEMDSVDSVASLNGNSNFGLNMAVPTWSITSKPTWLAISRVSAILSSVDDQSELPSIGGGNIDEGGHCFGQSIALTRSHLVVGAPGGNTFKPWNSRPEYINFGSGNQIGAVYVFELPSAVFSAEDVVSSMRGVNGGGPDAFKYIRSQPTADLFSTARRGIGLSSSSTYSITCRATSTIAGSRFGSSIAADVSQNGEQLNVWSGAPNANRVLTLSVGTVSRSCSLSTTLLGFRITSEIDIGTGVTLNDEMGYFGSPSAENSLINPIAVRGRLYVKSWCNPNRFINVAISTSYSRKCSSCAAGSFSRGEDVSTCFACPSTKPLNSVWIAGAGCVWTCSPGFFGPNCLPCTSLLGLPGSPTAYALTLSASFLLPANAQWNDDSIIYRVSNIQVCAWSCDFSYTVNSSLIVPVPGYAGFSQSLKISTNASAADIAAIIASVCIPPPPPAKLLPLVVLGMESDVLARTSDFPQNNITSSTVDIVLSVPKVEFSYCTGFRAFVQWSFWTGASGGIDIDIPIKSAPGPNSGFLIPTPSASTISTRLFLAAKSENIDFNASDYTIVAVKLRRLLGNSSYTVRMLAYNAGGYGPFSSIAPNQSVQGQSFFMTRPATPASPPGTPVASTIGSSSFVLSWASPSDFGGAPQVGFEICICAPTCLVAGPSTDFQTPCDIIIRRGWVNSTLKNFTGISSTTNSRIDDGSFYSMDDSEFRAAFARGLGTLFSAADSIVPLNATGLYGQLNPFFISMSDGALLNVSKTLGNITNGDSGVLIQSWLERVYGLIWRETSLSSLSGAQTVLFGSPDNRTSGISVPYLTSSSAYSASVQIFTSPLGPSSDRIILSSSPSTFSMRINTAAATTPSPVKPVFWVSGNVSTSGKATITLNSGIYCSAVPGSGSSLSFRWRAPLESGGRLTVTYFVTIAAHNARIEALANESALAYLRGEVRTSQSPDPFSAGSPLVVSFSDLSSRQSPWQVSPAIVSGLLANTRYVAAVNQQSGLRSDLAGIALADCITGPAVPPTSPLSVIATLSSLNSVVTVTWSPPADNGGVSQVSYSLLVSVFIPSNSSNRVGGVGVSMSNTSSSFPVALFKANSSASFSLFRVASGSTHCFFVISETTAGSSPSNFISDPTRIDSVSWRWPINVTSSSSPISISAPSLNSTRSCVTAPTQSSFPPSSPINAPVQYSILSSNLAIPPITAASLTFFNEALESLRSSRVESLVLSQLTSVPWSRIFHNKLLESINSSRTDAVELLQLLSGSIVTCAEGGGVNLQNLVAANSPSPSFSSGGGLLLSWLPPSTLGGYPVLDYVVEQSLDGWQSVSQSQSLVLVAPVDADGSDFAMPWTFASQSAELAQLYSATVFDNSTRLNATSLLGPLQAISRNLSSTCFPNNSTVRNVVAYVSALPSNSAVSFRVAAITAAGRGAFSAPSAPIVTGNATLPSRPGAVSVLSVTSSTVTLAWQPPLALGGVTSSQIRYVIYASVISSANNIEGCSSSAGWTRVFTTTNSLPTLVLSGLLSDVTYAFSISAMSFVGTGVSTQPVNVTTLSAQVPWAPHYTSMSILSTFSGSLRVSFLPSPVDGGAPLLGYRIYAALNSSVASVSWNSNAVQWALVGEISSPTLNSSVQSTCGLFRVSTSTDLFASVVAADVSSLPSAVASLSSASIASAAESFSSFSTSNFRLRSFIGPLFRLSEYVLCVSAYNRVGEGQKSSIIRPAGSVFASVVGVTTAGTAPTFVSTPVIAAESSVNTFFSPQDSTRALTSLSAFSLYRDATQFPIGSTFVHVAWAPPLDLGGLDLIGYNVYVGTSLSSLRSVAPIRVATSTLPTFSPPHPTAVFTGTNPSGITSCISSWASSTRLPCHISSSLSPQGAASLGLVKITGLQPKTLYFVAVSAVNSAGSSIFNSSLSVNFTTTSASPSISSPFAFREVAAASLLSSESSYPIVCGDSLFNSSSSFKDQLVRSSGGSVFFLWSPPVDTGGRKVTGYSLKVSVNTNQTYNVTILTGSAGLCSLSDGTLGYRLGCLNSSSIAVISVSAFTSAYQSPSSASVSYTASKATLPSAVPTGSILASLAASDTPGSVSLFVRWSSPFDAGSEPILSYTIEVSTVLPLFVKIYDVSTDTAILGGPTGNGTIGNFDRLLPARQLKGLVLSTILDLSPFVVNSRIFIRIAATSASGRGPFSALLPFSASNRKAGTVSFPTLSTLIACLPLSACYSESTLPPWQFSSALVLDIARLNPQDNMSIPSSPFLAPFSDTSSPPLVIPSKVSDETGAFSWIIEPKVTSITGSAVSLSSAPAVFINENITDECIISWRWAECSAVSNFAQPFSFGCPSTIYSTRLTGFLVQVFSLLSGTSPPVRSLWINSQVLLNETLQVNASISSSVRVAGLNAGATYVATVAACNIAGCGPYSSPAFFSTPMAASLIELSPPDVLTLSQNSTSSTCVNSGLVAAKPGSGVISTTVVPYELCDNSTFASGSSSCAYMIATLSSLRASAMRPTEIRVLLQPKDDTLPFLWPDTISYNSSIYAQRWAVQEVSTLASETSVGYFWGLATLWPVSRSQGLLSGSQAALGRTRTIWSGEGGVQANSTALLMAVSAGLASNTLLPKSVVSYSSPFIACRGTAPAPPAPPFLISTLSTQLNIGWEAPSLTGGRPIAAYVVQLACNQGASNLTWTVCGSVSLVVPQSALPFTLPSPLRALPQNQLSQSWVFTGLSVESPYRFRVLAINEIAGTVSVSAISPSLLSAITAAASTSFLSSSPVNVEGVGSYSMWSTTFSTAIATPPESPSVGPTIISVRESTIELSWVEPAAESTGGLPLIGYVIAIEGTATSPLASASLASSALPVGTTKLSEALPTPMLLQAAAAGISSTVEDAPTANAGFASSVATNGNIFVNVGCTNTIVLAGLRPGTSYRFALLLKTMAGSSELSPFTSPVTTLAGTHAPTAPGTPSCASPQLLRGLSQGLFPSSSALILFPLPAVLGDVGLSHFSVRLTTVGRGDPSSGWLGTGLENAETPLQYFISGAGADPVVEPLSRARIINVSASDAIFAGDVVIAGAASLGLPLPEFPNDSFGSFLGPSSSRIAWPGTRRLGALIVRHLSASTAYRVSVSAISASGMESPLSAQSRAFLTSEASPPAAPALVDTILPSISSSTVDVRILLPAEDGGEAITLYTIFASTDGGVTFDAGSSVNLKSLVAEPAPSPSVSQHCTLGAGIRGTPQLVTNQFTTAGPNSSGANLGEIRSAPTVRGLLASNETLSQWTNGAVLLSINSDINDLSLRPFAQFSSTNGYSGDGTYCSKLSTQMRLANPVSTATSASLASCVHISVRLTGLVAGTTYTFSATSSNAAGLSSNSPPNSKVLASSTSLFTNSSVRFVTSSLSTCSVGIPLRVTPLPAQANFLFTPKLWSGFPSQSATAASAIVTLPMSAPGPIDSVRLDWISSPSAPNSSDASLRSINANGFSTVSLSWVAPFDSGGMPISCYRIEVAIDGLLASGGTATGLTGTDMSDEALQVGGFSAASGFVTSLNPKPCDMVTMQPIISGPEPTEGSWTTTNARLSVLFNESNDYSSLPPWQPPPPPALQLSSEKLKELSGITPQRSAVLQAFDVLVGVNAFNLPFSGVFNSTARLNNANGVYNVIRSYSLPSGTSCSPDPTFSSSSKGTRSQIRSDMLRASRTRFSYTLSRSLPASAIVRVRIIPLSTAVFSGVGFSSGASMEGSAVSFLIFTPSTPPAAPASPVLVDITSTAVSIKFGAPPLVSSGSCATTGLQLYRAVLDTRTLSYSAETVVWSRFDSVDFPFINRTNSSVLLNKLTTPVIPVIGGPPPPISFKDVGLKRATGLRYRLAAFNCAGMSPFSTALFATTLTTPPSAPLNLTILGNADHVSVNLRWIQPPDDGGLTITSYVVSAIVLPSNFNLTTQVNILSNQSFWSGGNVITFSLDVINPQQTTVLFTLFPLNPGTFYAVRVVAVTSAGQGIPSAPIAFSTASPLKCPGLPDAVRGDCSAHGTCHAYAGTCTCDAGFSLPGCQFMNGVLFNASISYSSTAVFDVTQFQSTIAAALASNLSTSTIDSTRVLVFNGTSSGSSSVLRLLTGSSASQTSVSVTQTSLSVLFLLLFTQKEAEYRYSSILVALNASNNVPLVSAPAFPSTPLDLPPIVSTATLTNTLLLIASSGSNSLMSMGLLSLSLVLDATGSAPNPSSSVNLPLPDCSSQSDCVSCAKAHPTCGWCVTSAVCLLGTLQGASPWTTQYDVSTCTRPSSTAVGIPSSWFTAASITSTRKCPLECSALTSCSACAARSDCGWCEQEQGCVRVVDVTREKACLGATESSRVAAQSQFKTFYPLVQTVPNCPANRCRQRPSDFRCLSDPFCGLCVPSAYELSQGATVRCAAGSAFDFHPDAGVSQCRSLDSLKTTGSDSGGPSGATYYFRPPPGTSICTSPNDPSCQINIGSQGSCTFMPWEIASCSTCLAKPGCGFCAATGQCGRAGHASSLIEPLSPLEIALGTCSSQSPSFPSSSISSQWFSSNKVSVAGSTTLVTVTLPNTCPVKTLTPREVCMSASRSCLSCVSLAQTNGCVFCDSPRLAGITPQCMLLGSSSSSYSYVSSLTQTCSSSNQLRGIMFTGIATTNPNVFPKPILYPYTIPNDGIDLTATPKVSLLSLPASAKVGCPVTCVGQTLTFTSAKGSVVFGSANSKEPLVPQNYGLTERGTCTWTLFPLQTNPNQTYNANMLASAQFPSVEITFKDWDLAPGDSISIYDGPVSRTSKPMVTLTGSTIRGSTSYIYSTSTDVSLTKYYYGQSTQGYVVVVLSIETGGGQGFSFTYSGIPMSVVTVPPYEQIVLFVFGSAILVSVCSCCYCWCQRHRLAIARRDEEERAQQLAAQRRAQQEQTPTFVINSFPTFVFDKSTVHLTPILLDKTPEKDDEEEDKNKTEKPIVDVLSESPQEKLVRLRREMSRNAEETSAPSCSVCLSAFDDGDDVKILLCRHAFHRDCIDHALSIKVSCPMCRRSCVEMYTEMVTISNSGKDNPLKFGNGVVMSKPSKSQQEEIENRRRSNTARMNRINNSPEDSDAVDVNEGDILRTQTAQQMHSAQVLAMGRLRARALAAASGSNNGTGRIPRATTRISPLSSTDPSSTTNIAVDGADSDAVSMNHQNPLFASRTASSSSSGTGVGTLVDVGGGRLVDLPAHLQAQLAEIERQRLIADLATAQLRQQQRNAIEERLTQQNQRLVRPAQVGADSTTPLPPPLQPLPPPPPRQVVPIIPSSEAQTQPSSTPAARPSVFPTASMTVTVAGSRSSVPEGRAVDDSSSFGISNPMFAQPLPQSQQVEGTERRQARSATNTQAFDPASPSASSSSSSSTFSSLQTPVSRQEPRQEPVVITPEQLLRAREDEAMETLVAMGFNPLLARRALRRSNGDANAAAEILFASTEAEERPTRRGGGILSRLGFL
jgi:hypothetical protein